MADDCGGQVLNFVRPNRKRDKQFILMSRRPYPETGIMHDPAAYFRNEAKSAYILCV